MVFREVTSRYPHEEHLAGAPSLKAISCATLERSAAEHLFHRLTACCPGRRRWQDAAAKAVAEFLGDESRDPRRHVRYQTAPRGRQLIGMPRGIVGSERGGVLTNQLKDDPHCDPLDEVEKVARACSTCSCRFDEGWVTDAA